ncbi:MAG: hypothetical protein WBW27_20580, partial [Pseudolabrys sp.]
NILASPVRIHRQPKGAPCRDVRLAAIQAAPAFVRYWSKADKVDFGPRGFVEHHAALGSHAF